MQHRSLLENMILGTSVRWACERMVCEGGGV